MMKARQALHDAVRRLREAGIDQPAREARLILSLAMRLPDGVLPDEAAEIPASFDGLLNRRAAHEPMALLRGRQGFWSLDLAVSPDTLIPRADSETLIEAVLHARPDRASVGRIVDLGTGTGALLLATLSEYPAAWGVGIDLSAAACRLAAGNAALNGLADRAAFACGDWAAGIDARFDVALCNPPYIATADLAGLMPEVARHEPKRALDGGTDGLAAYRRVAHDLPRLLSAGGLAVLEIGEGQGREVAGLLSGAGLDVVGVRPDLGGIDRAVIAQKPVGAEPRQDYVKTARADLGPHLRAVAGTAGHRAKPV